MPEKHGKSKTREYRLWLNIKSKYPLCPEWMSFTNFFNDIGEIPKHKVAHRLDNSKVWSKDNFAWVTRRQLLLLQGRQITYENETLTVNQWARELNINVRTFKQRLRSGWDLEEIFYIEPKIGNNSTTRCDSNF